jgi:peptide/nickel transport system permease protein
VLWLIARRLMALVPVLLLVSFAVFFLLALIPGDPAVTLAGGTNATPEAIAHVRAVLHLNDPIVVQYGHWLGQVLHGNLGNSLISGQSVSGQIAARFPVTLGLVVAAAVVAVAVGLPLGVLSAVRPGGAVDDG